MSQFTDKVVLITGGAGGIGAAAALQFAAAGAQVVVTGRRENQLREFAAQHASVDYLVADAGKPEDAARTVEAVVARHGRLDVLVNNAGAATVMPLQQASYEQVMAILAVNVVGPSLLATAAVPHLARQQGSIVNVSSTYGHKAGANLSHYASSKAALEHMTRCWALELAPQGIRVNAVAAGPTETEFLATRMGLTAEQVESIKAAERQQIPLGRRGQPEDVARWIVSLAAPAVWMTGQVVAVDGGLNIA
ncbi:SDR family NAD(P)-dependent oxidoreductase [Bordetella petrii]|uniref:SDR family NAD(P)-dependent oxidoreductase n=1 Tax=Bordetella petrii TaxID=94624 RepID=UPI001A963489|nr:SDR family oxidoreductase [Bordetella petrii]MBO1114054.1 SDR family oxidoreductase [Bordetella petrii]